MFCKSTCRPANPATDAVKVDLAALMEERQREEALQRELEEQREHARAEEEEELRRAKEAERARVEEERRLEEQFRRAQEEEERLQLVQEEKQRRKREEEDRARAQRLAEERQREAQERKQALQRFLTRHGFTGVNEPRTNGCTFLGATKTYPLYCAAELGDAGAVEMLLKEGAMPSQKNSSGKTALQVAQKKGKSGSHDAVRHLLAGSCSQPLAGGA